MTHLFLCNIMSSLVGTPQPNTIDTLSLINKIRAYEPAIIKIIFDFTFVYCSEDKEGKYPYIWVLPAPGTKTILKDSFRTNKVLKYIIIDDSVETIEDRAFGGDCSMTDLIIGNSIKNIDFCAFNSCKKLKNLSFGKSVKVIGRSSFAWCISLTEVIIPDSVEKVCFEAFYKCPKLEKIIFGKSVKIIERCMAWHNPNLKELYFNDKLEFIGAKAFQDCISLNNITIPDSVQNIENYAFYNCDSLKNASIPSHLFDKVKKNKVFPEDTKITVRK